MASEPTSANPVSTKPYLIRAIHEWCNDSGLTPYITVTVDERTRVPMEHVRSGEIVLNLSPVATHRLVLGNDLIEFQARFSGTVRELSIPVENVSAIYARENGHGMAFEVVGGTQPRPEPEKHISDASLQNDATVSEGPSGVGSARLATVTPIGGAGNVVPGQNREPSAVSDGSDDDPDGSGSRSRGRAKLTRIK